jgi:hypothetical protein
VVEEKENGDVEIKRKRRQVWRELKWRDKNKLMYC